MAENPTPQQAKGCTGDCKRCSMVQRGYCASQIAYNNMLILNELRNNMKLLANKMDAMQGDAELVAPASKTAGSII